MPKGSNVYLYDAKSFLNEAKYPAIYDFILHDVFTGGIVYPSLFSIESLDRIRFLLKEDGVLALNFVGIPNSIATYTVHTTILTKFQYVKCFLENPMEKTFQNIVFFASNRDIDFNFNQNIPRNVDASYKMMKDIFIKMDGNFCSEFKNAEPISDRRNPLHELQYESAIEHWNVVRHVIKQDIWTQ
jgi:hypothetical protein